MLTASVYILLASYWLARLKRTCQCVCVCVCTCEGGRKGEGEREREE